MRRMAIVALIATAVLLLVVANPRSAITQYSSPVRVTNTPLQVSGAVAVSGNVNVANTPNVNVTSMPPVTVQAPAEAPEAIMLSRTVTASESVAGTYEYLRKDGVNYEVPAGKRLVIDTISVSIATPAGQHAKAWLGAWVGLFDHRVFLPLNAAPMQEYTYWETTQRVLWYVPAGGSMYAYLMRDSGAGIAVETMHVSGHLVDCPASGCD